MGLSDWLALWPAFYRLAIVQLALRRRDIQYCERRFDGGWSSAEPSPAEPGETPAEWHRWQQRAVALIRIARLVPGAQCLARALALRWWMRCHGIDAQLRIGVRQDNGTTHSHAWVDWQGQAVDEQADVVARHQVIWPPCGQGM